MAKEIEIKEIVNIEGRAVRIPKRDADGDILWKARCPVCDSPEPNSEAELESLDTLGAIRSLIFQVPSQIRKPDDAQNSFHVMNAIRQSKGDTLILEDADYEFLQRLIARSLPIPEGSSEDTVADTMGSALWGINSWVVTQQLTPEGISIEAAEVATK